MTIRATCLLLCSLIVTGPGVLAEEKTGWTLKAALKQMDKAAKNAGPLRSDAHYVTTDPAAAVNGQGTIFFRGDGSARADIPGDNPAIVYWLYAYLVAYDLNQKRLTSINFYTNPQVLAQYAMVGFSPAGSAMKKTYEVNLRRQEMLDQKPVLFFVLVPKDKELKKTISMIRLWVSVDNWFPAKQEVLHVAKSLQLTIRYDNLEPDEEREPSFFRPKVPEGTERISK
jgi:outer membrane lipoprotein-sorting protein